MSLSDEFKTLERNFFPQRETEAFKDRYGAVPVAQIAIAGEYRLQRADDRDAVMWALTKTGSGEITIVPSPRAYTSPMSEAHGTPLFLATNSTFDMVMGTQRAAATSLGSAIQQGNHFTVTARGGIDATGRDVTHLEMPRNASEHKVSRHIDRGWER